MNTNATSHGIKTNLFAYCGEDRSDPHAVKLSLSPEDQRKFRDLPTGWSTENAEVTDQSTGQRWAVRRADCGASCYCAASAIRLKGTDTQETKIVSVEIEIAFERTSDQQITVSLPQGFISGERGEIYFSHSDGTKFEEIFPAFADIFPAGCSPRASSTPTSGAWIDGFGFNKIDIAGTYRVRFTQIFTKAPNETEFDWLEDQVAIIAKN